MTRVTLCIQGYALYEQTVLSVNALCKRLYIDITVAFVFMVNDPFTD